MKKYNLPKQKYFMAFILSLFTLVGCYTNDLEPIPDFNEDNTYVISMKMPGSFAQTRAMSIPNESKINDAQVYFLVFKKAADGKERFAYSAPVKKSTVNPTNHEIVYEINLRPNAAGNTDESRIVIIANHQLTALPTVGAEKETFLSTLEFNSNGAWDVSTPKLFPMWGELATLVEVKETMTSPLGTINMLRAVARIDVGLDYTNPTIPADENVNGLTNFKLHSVHVFRTNESGRVVPDKNNIDATGKAVITTIPAGVQTKAFANYLSYQNNAAGNSLVVDNNKMIREIYISEIKGAATEEDRHFLVIGGYYDGDTYPTYYRVNFEAITADAHGIIINVQKYNDILRNHNYKVNIKQVSGRGHGTIEDAANSMPANISATVTSWEDKNMNMFVNGRYFFAVSERKIIATDDASATAIITYDTDLKNLTATDFNVVWDDPGQQTFKVDINATDTDKSIVFTTLNENTTDNPIEQKATLKVKGIFDIPITVVQNPFIALYLIDCSTMKVNPKSSYNLEITLRTLDGQPMKKDMKLHLKSDTVDGFSFQTSSHSPVPPHGPLVFPQGASEVTVALQRAGQPNIKTPGKELVWPKKQYMTIRDTKTGNTATCDMPNIDLYKVQVNVVGGMNHSRNFWESSYLVDARSNSYKLLKNPYNFGSPANATAPTYMRFDISTYGISSSAGEHAWAWPLIVISDFSSLGIFTLWDQGAQITDLEAQQLYNALHINDPRRPFIYISFLGSELNKPLLDLLLPNAIIRKATNPKGPERISTMTSDIDDLITNGPFGDVRGKHWEYNTLDVAFRDYNDGQDQKSLKFDQLAGLYDPDGGITSYSSAPIPKQPGDPADAVYSTMYKVNGVNCFIVEYPLHAFGNLSDGISPEDAGNPSDTPIQLDPNQPPVKFPGRAMLDDRPVYNEYDPNNWFVPIPGDTIVNGTMIKTYNTVIFCNMMTWAAQEAIRAR